MYLQCSHLKIVVIINFWFEVGECNESGYWSIYKSDKFGFNNPQHIWNEENLDILLIGDSYVHGDCVSPDENISNQIMLNSNKKVLNLGFRGNSPYLQLGTFLEYGINRRPKNIFWFFSEENDYEEIQRDKNKKIITSYLNQDYSQNLINYQSNIDDKLNKLHNEIVLYRNFKLQNLRLNLINKIVGISKVNNKEKKYRINLDSEKIYSKILGKAANISKNNNIKLTIVYLPGYIRYKGVDYSELKESVKNICNKLDINFIDIDKEVFSKKKDPLIYFPFKINSHYTKEGYKEISNVILNSLED